MKIAPLAEVKDRLSALDSLLLTHDRKFVRLLAEARERGRAGQFLTSEQFWRELRRRRTPRAPSIRRARTTRQ